MHNYIMCRKHFVYIVERNTLWCACCARSLQTNNLIIYMRLKIYRRIFFGGIFYIVLKKNMSLRKFDFFTGVVYGDNYLWSMRSDFKSLYNGIKDFCVIHIYSRFVVTDDFRRFARRKIKVCGIADSAEFLRCYISKQKLCRVKKLHKYNIALFNTVCFHGICKLICSCV